MNETVPTEFAETEALLAGLRDIHLPAELQTSTGFVWLDGFLTPAMLWPLALYALYCGLVFSLSYRRRTLWRRQAKAALTQLVRVDAPLGCWVLLRRQVARHGACGPDVAPLVPEIFTAEAEQTNATKNALKQDIERMLA